MLGQLLLNRTQWFGFLNSPKGGCHSRPTDLAARGYVVEQAIHRMVANGTDGGNSAPTITCDCSRSAQKGLQPLGRVSATDETSRNKTRSKPKISVRSLSFR
jgi:hypothetical protein